MVRPFVVATALASLAILAGGASAQDLSAICRQVTHPASGVWSEYRMVGGEGNGATMRIAVVGTERHADTTYLWLEFAARGFPMGGEEGAADSLTMINKMLVADFGAGMGAARSHVIKIGTAPAMEMPAHGVPGGAPGTSSMEECQDSRVVGWESVTVPAGTFRALHLRDADNKGDTWISADIPFGMVKAATGDDPSDSGRMVLVAHGTGARSQITETPQPYDARRFMQMLMQGRRPPER
jgi:hypothetical protein